MKEIKNQYGKWLLNRVKGYFEDAWNWYRLRKIGNRLRSRGLKVILQQSKINPEVKRLWVNALLSGEYKKTQLKLREEDSYCVVGLLCELHRKETGVGDWRNKNSYIGWSLIAPREVKEWAGVVSDYFLNTVAEFEYEVRNERGELIRMEKRELGIMELNDFGKREKEEELVGEFSFEELGYVIERAF